MSDAVVAWDHLGKFDADGVAFVKEALEAADIQLRVVGDSPGSKYSPALGRMEKLTAMYDVQVPADRLADAKAVIQRWEQEAEEAAIRESGAPPEGASEETEPAAEETQKRSLWPVVVIMAIGGAILVYFMGGGH